MLKNLIARKVSVHSLVPGTEYIALPRKSLPEEKGLFKVLPFRARFRSYEPYKFGDSKNKNAIKVGFDNQVVEDYWTGKLRSGFMHVDIEPNDKGFQSFYNFYTIKKVRTNKEEKQLKNLAKTRKNEALSELRAIPNIGINYMTARNNAISRGYATRRKTRKSRR